ncbi:MAG: radical SAM protein, partial [Syntrophomonadaceae bacterium]|nr:radical SAM protein [Syntrophomonadaceae bacterium]
MIGCTKLLCGTATVSEAIRHQRDSRQLRPGMLQFSTAERPLVVWNTTNRCNLRCQHCYINAEDRSYRNELSTEEARVFIKNLGEMGVPVLLFSGGEPLLRPDLMELA